MATDTAQYIDNLVQIIATAEAAESVTNEQVARVFAFLCSRAKELQTTIDTAPSVADETANRKAADAALGRRIDALLSDNASEAIENFNEIKRFLANFKDSDDLASMLGELRLSISNIQKQTELQSTIVEKLTPIRIESEEALEAMKLLGLLKDGHIYYIPEED